MFISPAAGTKSKHGYVRLGRLPPRAKETREEKLARKLYVRKVIESAAARNRELEK